jgi:uncharacterized protein YndB with AHSA1/START domain
VSRYAIVYEVVYAHPPKSAWLVLTDPGALAEWLTPNDFQPRVGHRFAFRTRPQPDWDGVVECEVVELEEQKKVVYTWKGEPSIPETLVPSPSSRRRAERASSSCIRGLPRVDRGA